MEEEIKGSSVHAEKAFIEHENAHNGARDAPADTVE
jgi:hypothetical protein